MRLAILALLFTFAASNAVSDDFSPGNIGQQARAANTGAPAVPPPVALNQKVGRPSPRPFRDAFINGAVAWMNDKDSTIVLFVNDKGCVLDKSGAKKALTTAEFRAGVAAAAAKTEIVFVTPAQMKTITGLSMSRAFGITAALKAKFAADTGINIGTPGKHTVAYKGDPPDPSEPVTGDDPGGWIIRHELLHILLRLQENPALGGGSRKDDPDPAIAQLHHQLTDYLGWTQFRQAPGAWTPPSQPPQCH